MQDLLQAPLYLLKRAGICPPDENKIHYQTDPDQLSAQTVSMKEGVICENGALAIRTGKFTGRSPRDRFIVKDEYTESFIDWNTINQPFAPERFDRLRDKVTAYLQQKELWVRDSYACADERFRLNIRIITERPWASLFCYNMFLRPDAMELEHFEPEWIILHAPSFHADPETDGTRQENFVLINYSRKEILIGGTAYTGEIKKGIFSVLNGLLPHEEGVLSMHCSANVGERGDTALFFGLSGTGKTTLSNDPGRLLIGDDEHGWSDDNIFNFEGGCYAKCIDLKEEKEPQIYEAIREGALIENVTFFKGTHQVNYKDSSITPNTRVSYPMFHLENRKPVSAGDPPENIFFLTCDAYGILPPVSKLTPAQAMYQFISGYTAKVAGTETGVNEPEATFSTCFAAPFIPLHPIVYANMLGKKLKSDKVNCWLVNTGWSGGKYGTGDRIPLTYTRNIIHAVLEGNLNKASFKADPVFGLAVPDHCPGVPDKILCPRETWEDPAAYDREAKQLARMFIAHFEQFTKEAGEEIRSAAPRI